MTSLVVALLLAAPAPVGSRLQRMAEILSLEDRRTLGAGEIERLLRDPDRGVRRRAALAAGRIADPAALPPLMELLADAEPEVRQMSAFALGLIGDRSAAERLVAALQDPDAVVRGRAAEALGRLGDSARAREVAAMVLRAIPREAPLVTVRGDDPGSASDPWLELRLGLLALARLQEPAAAEQALLLQGRPRFDWWAAVYVASRVASPRLRPVLVAGAGSNDPSSRALAARGFGALKDASALEMLIRLSQDHEQDVAVNALRSLAALGDARATAAAAALLGSPSLALRAEALRALAVLPPDRSLRNRILPLAGHEAPSVRAAAFAALARLGAEELALVLSGLDPDPDWSVRAGLARALGEVGGEIGVGLLFEMLKDEDSRVLPAALQALRKARGSDATETLVRHLRHPDLGVRAAAAEEIAALKAAGLVDDLLAAWKQSLGDADLEARLAQVAALAAQPDPASLAALRQIAREDPARPVRGQACSALRNRGEAAPALGPEPVERPVLDYREAMAPYDPSPDRRVFTPRAILHTLKGKIEIHLNVVEAPLATAAFVRLARRGFYEGLSFHRVVPGFVAQGGCPRGDGNGGPGDTLRDEIGQQPFGRGTVGIALSGRDTGGSQFFIALQPAPHLDGGYSAVGRVVNGMEVVDRLQPGDSIEHVEIWDGRP